MAAMARMRARIELCLGGRVAAPVYEALKAEEAQPSPDRGRVRVELEGECVVIEVEPRDAGSMRALANSFLYLAHAAADAVERSSGGRG